MAIRYDANYNREISKVVKNFNNKRNRAIKRGLKNVPAPIKVSDLKARYTSRKELNRQLELISSFSASKSALKKVENQGGATAIDWEFQYLKSNAKAAKEFFAREYALILPKYNDFPGERMRLDNLRAKMSILDLDVAYMDQSQFNAYRSTIKEYINKPSNYAAGYRGFLSQVEIIMKYLGVPDTSINTFFDKMKTLTPEQFHKMYEESSLVSRIFELADSPAYTGTLKLNTSDDDAKEFVDELLEQADDLIKEAKKDPLEEFDPFGSVYKGFDKGKDTPKPTSSGKLPRSKLSKTDIERLKILGWEDLIDENE